MIDKNNVISIIRTWPLGAYDDLYYKIYIWCYYLMRYEGKRQWVEYFINNNNLLPKDLIIGMIKSNELSDSILQNTLGYFLDEFDEDYVDLSRRVEPNVKQDARNWVLKSSRGNLDDLFNRS